MPATASTREKAGDFSTGRLRWAAAASSVDVRAAAADGSRVLRWFDCPVVDAQGELVARVHRMLWDQKVEQAAVKLSLVARLNKLLKIQLALLENIYQQS